MDVKRSLISLQILAFLSVGLAGCWSDDGTSTRPSAGDGGGDGGTAALQFRIDEGGQINAFYRQDQVAAHLLARSSAKPRLLAIFPAGNSGTGLWFDDTPQAVNWTLDAPVASVHVKDAKGRDQYGIGADLTVDTDQLTVRAAVLSSVRFLRDYNGGASIPDAIGATPTITGSTVSWARDRVDGAPGYALRVSLREGGGVTAGPDGKPRLRAAAGARALRVHVEAVTGETPLTPIDKSALFTSAVNPDDRSQNVLAFLSYEDKLLAGSWQYDTYFGRDTLISLRMLMPALQPVAVEAGLSAVLARLSTDGRVAHEEGIGEFALIDNQKQGRANDPTPTYDYKMIDGDYLLAPILSAWLIDDPRGQARARAYLAEVGRDGVSNGSRLVRNLMRVAGSAQAFAAQPVVANLIQLRRGEIVGNWRDSTDGLGGGVYPYDVNAVLVPAALRATGAFLARGLLDPYLDAGQRAQLATAAASAAVWEAEAPNRFQVTVPAAQAAARVARYAAQVGVPAAAAPGGPLSFYAVSLDAQGQPVGVMNSDGGFALVFGAPPADMLERIATDMMRPFPAGLATDIGMLVANPVYADESLWPKFSSSAYHGTVVWSWQQALWAAGLDRQLARQDLPASTRTLLEQTRTRLWQMVENAKEMRASEMWTWSYVDGRYRSDAFGTRSTDVTESNAAQLWSTTYLAIHAPQQRAGRYWWARDGVRTGAVLARAD
ncbi:hypothetical protein Bsp3421_001035 [Burkholderia sp. FERM BP-3421]|uniref:hypothetical protein n=1 Tax=Burkholderia sp. FERM BP-3421 TaxID=1494466 RepID=UPI002361F98D|nr:hypothetical protein [Burkholderia sp. FERM BP-3421]WDD91140.1 hypothetical protein Bsp3421_001035 [Burkholderia sp. FERM BP-3421]